MTDLALGALIATTAAMALQLLLLLSAAVWLWQKVRKFRKLWIEQDKGVKFGGELR